MICTYRALKKAVAEVRDLKEGIFIPKVNGEMALYFDCG